MAEICNEPSKGRGWPRESSVVWPVAAASSGSHISGTTATFVTFIIIINPGMGE